MKTQNVSQKLISSHLISGEMNPGTEIGLKIDQVLLQDATGTLVMLELEAFNLNKIKPEVAVQYVDHNLLQTDYKNMDDHLFLQSAAARFGYWFSRSGNGIFAWLTKPLHSIMNWFEDDFNGEKGILIFLKKFEIIPKNAHPKIQFKEYDWTILRDKFAE